MTRIAFLLEVIESDGLFETIKKKHKLHSHWSFFPGFFARYAPSSLKCAPKPPVSPSSPPSAPSGDPGAGSAPQSGGAAPSGGGDAGGASAGAGP